MNSQVLVSLIVFACVYGGAILGFAVRIPSYQRDPDSRDVLKAATGLVGTMAALVLGLLVASAKDSYDHQKDELIRICADVSLLDRALANYGPEGAATRQRLRSAVEAGFLQLWKRGPEAPSTEGEALYDAIDRLPVGNEQQRTFKSMAAELAIELGKTRWLMHAQNASAISTPLLVVVVFWLSILFVSFGVYAKPSATGYIALFICALSVAAAVFLILEMDRPFDGLIRISDEPLRGVLNRLGKD